MSYFQGGALASAPLNMQHVPQMNGLCTRCGYTGSDVKVLTCGCSFHARCINIVGPNKLTHCPQCHIAVSSLALYPMSFEELDAARKAPPSKKKSKKRKEPGGNTLDDSNEGDCRTGRWTADEMNFCDRLIDTFKLGNLPLADGVKLNDFLSSMLKSKQSRLTKKMKNANLSGKIFKVSNGYIADMESCRKFSEVEDAFLTSLSDPVERAVVRFHMQKKWREWFSAFCVNYGQSLDADAWLSSVEEMEKRESLAKDAARMARRKMMMGIALDQDIQNPDQGVFIDRSGNTDHGLYDSLYLDHDDLSLILSDKPAITSNGKGKQQLSDKHYWHYSSPFLGKAIAYIQRHGCPFEYIDVWVPSFLPDGDASQGSGSKGNNSNCRLCFAGFATADTCIPPDGRSQAEPVSQDEQYHLLSFGDYSQKFSFNVGCGLPGRVYETGVPTWEQSVQNAPHQHFERCGGAIQWGVKTVVGIPIPSPNVGRIVVVLYSKHDRNKDQDLVGRLYEEFKKMVPSPKWKLVVDIGKSSVNEESLEISAPLPAQNDVKTSSMDHTQSNGMMQNGFNANGNSFQSAMQGNGIPTSTTPQASGSKDQRIDELVALLGEQMPHDPNSPQATYFQHFMSLRLMLLKPNRSDSEREIEEILLSSFSSYKSSGRENKDIAIMIARDFMFLKQSTQQAQIAPPQQSPQLSSAASNPNFMQQAQVPQHFQLPQQQQQHAMLDASNHSVVGMANNGHIHRPSSHSGIPDVSNHSQHVNIGPPPQQQHNIQSQNGQVPEMNLPQHLRMNHGMHPPSH